MDYTVAQAIWARTNHARRNTTVRLVRDWYRLESGFQYLWHGEMRYLLGSELLIECVSKSYIIVGPHIVPFFALEIVPKEII
jgi:hypothetical protein